MRKNKITQTMSITVLIVLVTGFLFYCYFLTESNSTDIKEIIARNQTHKIGLSIAAYWLENDRFPTVSNIDHYWAGTLSTLSKTVDWGVSNECGISTNDWIWLDPWGTPYELEVIGITSTTNDFINKFGSNITARVWSHGVDRTNSYGKNDDIVFDIP